LTDKLFITGATGFIGSQLARRLCERYEVHALTRNDKFMANANIHDVKYHSGDLTDVARLREILAEIRPKIVVHLAAYTPVRFSYSSPYEYLTSNTLGTSKLVEVCLGLKHRVEQFVYASTAEVYGYTPNEKVIAWCEDDSPQCGTPYAISKYAGELYVRYAGTRGLHYTILRCTNTYGRSFELPDEARGYFVEKCILQMLANSKGVISFDGYASSSRRWMHYLDHVGAYDRVIGNPRTINEIYNVAPQALESKATLGQVAEQIRLLTKFDGIVMWAKDPRPIDPNFLDIDPSKIRSAVGWAASVPLTEGLAMTVEYWKEKLSKPTAVDTF